MIKLEEIIEFIKDDIIEIYNYRNNIGIKYLKAPDDVDDITLDWIGNNNSNKQKMAEKSNANVIIVNKDFKNCQVLTEKVFIIVENPKLTIAKIGNHFLVKRPSAGIHETAIIHPEALIGKNVYIGPYATIGNSIIGDNVHIFENIIISDEVKISSNVIINSNAIIGTDGLGCEREDNNELITFPHFGSVIIEENVNIGASTIIARGVFKNTIICKGSKINAGCFIAHNVRIGENTWISPKVNIAGSVNINKNSTIFSGAIIREHIKIGEEATIGMGAVVTKNVPDGETWVGNPARKLDSL